MSEEVVHASLKQQRNEMFLRLQAQFEKETLHEISFYKWSKSFETEISENGMGCTIHPTVLIVPPLALGPLKGFLGGRGN